mgnify:CR=1 FL=1
MSQEYRINRALDLELTRSLSLSLSLSCSIIALSPKHISSYERCSKRLRQFTQLRSLFMTKSCEGALKKHVRALDSLVRCDDEIPSIPCHSFGTLTLPFLHESCRSTKSSTSCKTYSHSVSIVRAHYTALIYLPPTTLLTFRFAPASVLDLSDLGSNETESTDAGQKDKEGVSISDFDIIKPISRGSFGYAAPHHLCVYTCLHSLARSFSSSVLLARKKKTGDVYAIKVLKKDKISSKNQLGVWLPSASRSLHPRRLGHH